MADNEIRPEIEVSQTDQSSTDFFDLPESDMPVRNTTFTASNSMLDQMIALGENPELE